MKINEPIKCFFFFDQISLNNKLQNCKVLKKKSFLNLQFIRQKEAFF
jgi:hypothetical protein